MIVAGIVVLGLGMYLAGLGIAALFMPDRTTRFLLAHASSGPVHFLELSLRFAAGAAILQFSSWLRFPVLFEIFGWVLLVTTAALLLVPWQMHRRFSAWAVPQATRYIGFLGFSSLSGGLFVLYSADWGRQVIGRLLH